MRQTRIHLSLLLVAVVALFIWRYWLDRFELNFSTAGVVFGATYTDIHARLPFLYVGMALGVHHDRRPALLDRSVTASSCPAAAMGLWIVVAIARRRHLPGHGPALHRAAERAREGAPVHRAQHRRRHAPPSASTSSRSGRSRRSPSVTPQEIADNPETIGNIRLLDVRPATADLRPDPDDPAPLRVHRRRRRPLRHRWRPAPGHALAARARAPAACPPDAQSWVNRRLQFTHGYGAVMSPVNEVVQEGLPELFLQRHPDHRQAAPSPGPRSTTARSRSTTSSSRPTTASSTTRSAKAPPRPSSKAKAASSSATSSARLVLAWEFADLNILISGSPRLTRAASSSAATSRTASRRWRPSSPRPRPLPRHRRRAALLDPGRLHDDRPLPLLDAGHDRRRWAAYNYIRNSVKVVVNAYDGATTFYQVDDNDPIIRTYAKIFPKLFTPLDGDAAGAARPHPLPGGPLPHRRSTSTAPTTSATPDALYNREDIWNIPTGADRQRRSAGRALLRDHAAAGRDAGGVHAHPAADARPPPEHDRLGGRPLRRAELRQPGRPTGSRPTSLVFGPQQVESRIDQDPTISAQFSLWNQSGSNVIRGNLLMIPIGNGNMFVEPIYLQAESSQPAGAQARRRRQRQPHRHGAHARPRPRGRLRPRAAHRPAGDATLDAPPPTAEPCRPRPAARTPTPTLAAPAPCRAASPSWRARPTPPTSAPSKPCSAATSPPTARRSRGSSSSSSRSSG